MRWKRLVGINVNLHAKWVEKDIRRNSTLETRELLTPTQRKRLYEMPEHMDKRELACYYTFSDFLHGVAPAKLSQSARKNLDFNDERYFRSSLKDFLSLSSTDCRIVGRIG
jgi:hypothetical protein